MCCGSCYTIAGLFAARCFLSDAPGPRPGRMLVARGYSKAYCRRLEIRDLQYRRVSALQGALSAIYYDVLFWLREVRTPRRVSYAPRLARRRPRGTAPARL